MLSLRIARLRESATIRMMEKAKELESRGVEIIHLDVGEPDFQTPKEVMDAACNAMRDGYTHYTPSRGLPELREAIADKLRSENGIDVTASNILVTPGSKQALLYTFLALLDEGDEVIIPTPAWPSYWEMANIAGAIVKQVPPKDGFGLNLEDIEALIGEKTKMIVINSPNNPSGAVFTKETLEGLVELAIRRKIIIASDEVYEKIIYEGSHVSPASLPGGQEFVVTVNGFSKTFAMTGWRLGYLAGPKQIVEAAAKIQQHSATCAPAFAQKAVAEVLAHADKLVKPMVREFRRRRDFIVPSLEKMDFNVRNPAGAFYVFPEIPGDEPDAPDFVEKILEKAGVSITSGSSFGGFNRSVRISYANNLENISKAIERIRSTISS